MAPIEFGAMKTIVIRQIYEMIDDYNDEEIKESIEYLNEWAKVEEIFKFGTTSKMLKVRFTNTAMVKRAESQGIVVLNQGINPRRIEREREIFIKINACNNCFKYDHDTKRCDKDKKMLCAFCGEEGHKQGQCKSTVPKCLNCGGDHKTLAAKCQVRKNLIKEKRKESVKGCMQ